MRWKKVVLGLALSFASALGCKQQCYITECDLKQYQTMGGIPLPAHLEHQPGEGLEPITQLVGAPKTVLDPEREWRWLTLREATAIALEQGNIGSQSPNFPGVNNDNLVSFQGRFVSGSDSIRVLSLDPAIVGADIQASLAKFDARFQANMTWNTTDRPVGTALETFQASFGRINNIGTNDAQFRAGLIKPLPTGGVAGITFTTDYQLSNLNQRVNPAYRPALQFAFEQPLLQGFGVEINQLRATHPGSIVTPFQTGGRVEGILITRLRFDQQRAEFERQIHHMLLNVEVAYWNLYGSYWNLLSRESGFRQALEAWRIVNAGVQAGAKPAADLAQTRLQLEQFRAQRFQAMGQVLENERQLRGLLGMSIEDGTRLVPADEPTVAPYNPDWSTALHEALTIRPELILARQDLKFRQLDVINQKNLLMPDLRFTSNYDINGIGSRLDGPGPGNALRSLASNQFNNWGLGFRLDMPIGFRDAHAALRVARLNLVRSYASLGDQELKAQRYLAQQYSRLFEYYETIRAQRAQRQAARVLVEARSEAFRAGKREVTADVLAEAQRFFADALREEFNAIVNYNNTLAAFEFARGTIMQHNNVSIAEGPLPHCALMRAVEHERERSKAFVLRERPAPGLKQAGCDENGLPLPKVSAEGADPLPKVLGDRTLLPGSDEDTLPGPRPHAGAMLPDLPAGPVVETESVPVPRTSPVVPRTLAPAVRGDERGNAKPPVGGGRE